MDDKGIKYNRARYFLEKLNKDFRNSLIIGDEFYRQLLENGVDMAGSILVSVSPDGDNTYIGTIIRQDGKVFEFDLDVDNSSYSIWTEITEQFFETCEVMQKSRSWGDEVIAYQLFREKGLPI